MLCVVASGSSNAVQQSQVSSSKPAILASDVLGPLLLEVNANIVTNMLEKWFVALLGG